MDIAQRILEIMRVKGLKQADLARLTGYSGPAIKKITEGGTEPKFGFLKTIINRYKDISPNWLLTGNGRMELDFDSPIELQEPREQYGYGDQIELDIKKLKGSKALHKLAFFLNQYYDELCEDEVFSLFADRLKKDHQRELYRQLRAALEKETKMNEEEIKRILTLKPNKVNG